MCWAAALRSVEPGGGKAVTTMQHELAMRYLIEQRSEQLIGQAERLNLAAGLRPARLGRFARIGRSVVALVARVTTRPREARPERGTAAPATDHRVRVDS
jgi:hypothetical protein